MHCLCCNRPVRKNTECVLAPRMPNKMVPVDGWEYSGNLHVVARNYEAVDPVTETFVMPYDKEDRPEIYKRRVRRLRSVHVWDGQSYLPVAKYFCCGPCAQKFARAAAEAGYRITRKSGG